MADTSPSVEKGVILEVTGYVCTALAQEKDRQTDNINPKRGKKKVTLLSSVQNDIQEQTNFSGLQTVPALDSSQAAPVDTPTCCLIGNLVSKAKGRRGSSQYTAGTDSDQNGNLEAGENEESDGYGKEMPGAESDNVHDGDASECQSEDKTASNGGCNGNEEELCTEEIDGGVPARASNREICPPDQWKTKRQSKDSLHDRPTDQERSTVRSIQKVKTTGMTSATMRKHREEMRANVGEIETFEQLKECRYIRRPGSPLIEKLDVDAIFEKV